MTDILQTVGLTRAFGGVVAVDCVDLAIAEGELRCLIGPNGAGKSTLFKCLTGQLRPTSGDVIFRGRSIAGRERHEVSRLGIAIKNQVPSVMGELSVRENIWLAARRHAHGTALERHMDEILAEIGVGGEAGALIVDELSHAHRQWVELGVLLASKPALALLDEPTAGMTRDEMLKTVKLIRRLNENAAIVVVEHDLDFISLLATRVTVLHQGRVFLDGTMEDVAGSSAVREIYLGKSWRPAA